MSIVWQLNKIACGFGDISQSFIPVFCGKWVFPTSAFHVLFCTFLKVAAYSTAFHDIGTHTIVGIVRDLSVVRLRSDVFLKQVLF